MTDPTLYHYTCAHSAAALGEGTCVLLPLVELVRYSPYDEGVWGPGRAVWLTDLARPERSALGLTSVMLTCDRTVARYRVLDNRTCTSWGAFARTLSYDERESLEAAPGARPAHWWLSKAPVLATYDPLS